MDTKDKLEIALAIWSNITATISLILSIKKPLRRSPPSENGNGKSKGNGAETPQVPCVFSITAKNAKVNICSNNYCHVRMCFCFYFFKRIQHTGASAIRIMCYSCTCACDYQ